MHLNPSWSQHQVNIASRVTGLFALLHPPKDKNNTVESVVGSIAVKMKAPQTDRHKRPVWNLLQLQEAASLSEFTSLTVIEWLSDAVMCKWAHASAPPQSVIKDYNDDGGLTTSLVCLCRCVFFNISSSSTVGFDGGRWKCIRREAAVASEGDQCDEVERVGKWRYNSLDSTKGNLETWPGLTVWILKCFIPHNCRITMIHAVSQLKSTVHTKTQPWFHFHLLYWAELHHLICRVLNRVVFQI